MQITYSDGGRGTASVETGKRGGEAMVLRRGYPVAAEVVAGIPLAHITPAMLAALNVTEGDAADLCSLRSGE